MFLQNKVNNCKEKNQNSLSQREHQKCMEQKSVKYANQYLQNDLRGHCNHNIKIGCYEKQAIRG